MVCRGEEVRVWWKGAEGAWFAKICKGFETVRGRKKWWVFL